MSAFPLQCGVQQYEWGKLGSDSLVAKMVGRSMSHPDAKFAELWVGTHPSLPSFVHTANGDAVPLHEFLASSSSQSSTFYSAEHQQSPFSGQVPFLLKILSIGKALSIQAHPDKALAEVLHARDPKNYKDPNHKPELIVALTPFEGLCCFRRAAVVQQFVKSIPPLAALLGQLSEDVVVAPLPEAEYLRKVMSALYTAPKRELEASLAAHRDALLAQTNSTQRSAEDAVFLRLGNDYPGDVGCWMVYILNLVSLKPGEGLFLSANEPHAYLSGDGVEVMATSDNVVRAGLTPKFMDVDTLLAMLTYNPGSFEEAFRPAASGEAVQLYQPPARYPDFSLYRVETTPEKRSIALRLPTLGLGLVLSGEGTVNGVEVKQGGTFVCTAEVQIEATSQQPLSLFVASTNNLAVDSKL